MASYLELIDVQDDSQFRARIMVACVVAAEVIRQEPDATPNHAERVKWARRAYSDPQAVARDIVWSVLAQNKQFPKGVILGVDDATLQTAVNAALTGAI